MYKVPTSTTTITTTTYTILHCESKKLHHFTFAIILSKQAIFDNYWHTCNPVNLEQNDVKISLEYYLLMPCEMQHAYTS